MRALLIIAALIVAAPAMGQITDPAKNPCAGANGLDICAAAKATAKAISPKLPREIAPGIWVQSADQGGPQVQLQLMVASDLRLPDEAGFAKLACGEPPLAALIMRGGQVAYHLNDRVIATVTSCKEAD
ncbi:MAG: hypothetical protein DI533_00095 [Cereibacter sphaeroides]|uniref:Uncharacterized protein n=1 Tax=Cereibacter sphaeroides TaxID=1063 RepID=A0A2W5UMQ5_CERSP|nr:MAG: hypothetical protein DI533_00095 [Cereibacter sphaeroides]